MVLLLVEHFFNEEGRRRFPQWVREIGEAARRFEGFIAIQQWTRLDDPERCFFLLEFDAPEQAQRWVASEERQRLLDQAAPYRLKPQEGTRWTVGERWTPENLPEGAG